MYKHGGARDLNKQENKIQCRTYCRSDYNRDKNNIENNCRCSIGHGGGQQRYNRNPRQDNSNNVITLQLANSNNQNHESEEIGDILAEVLTCINCRRSSTETIIVPETQDNDRMNSFLVNSPSQ